MPALTRLPRALAIAMLALGVVAALAAAPTTGSADPAERVALRAATAPAALAQVGRISSGGMVSCHVNASGGLWCVGENRWGQLGVGDNKDKLLRRYVGPDFVDVSTSGATTCGIREEVPGDRRLWCWGMNTRGQLGIGDKPQQWAPRQVEGKAWRQVSASWLNTCGIQEQVEGQRKLFCWGAGSYGQIGDGTFSMRKRPLQVGTSTDWLDVAAGGWHTCGLRTGGVAYCWGRNDFGQLGTGSTKRLVRPAKVATEARFKSIDATWNSTCGLTFGGKIYCWGENDKGQLGDGTRATRLSPVPVKGSNFTQLAVGDRHTCGLSDNGAMWCWGGNRYGQHGNGTRSDSLTPRRVPVRTYADADAGWVHTCGLKANDELECWGNNESGQLGEGDRTDRTTPPGVNLPLQRETKRALDRQLEVVSFNVLGTNHTEPGGSQLNMAPGRMRGEWMSDLMDSWGADIVAYQELKEDQYRHLQQTMGREFAFYPANDRAGKVVWQSVMWDKAEYKFVLARNISVPVLGKTRPNPMVVLRSRLTGKLLIVFNVHNSAGSAPARVRERRLALAQEIRVIKRERANKRPFVFIGDLNERREAFCRVTIRTDLYAVNGGSRAEPCRPPRRMHIDWAFVSPHFKTRWFEYNRSTRVTRLTDHSVLRARTTIPGARR